LNRALVADLIHPGPVKPQVSEFLLYLGDKRDLSIKTFLRHERTTTR
jgi:hypothetical protein